MLVLNQECFDDIVALLLPLCRMPAERTGLLTPLFAESPNLYNGIDWTGAPQVFAANLVHHLATHGQVESGQEALIALLQGVRAQVGIDVQKRIGALVDTIIHSQSRTPTTGNIEAFLCYSSQDRMQAAALRDALAHAGISVWQDITGIPAGSYFGIEIEQAIRRANAVIVLITQAASQSEWVRNEIAFAQAMHKPIFPLLLHQDASPMIEIYAVQHIAMHLDWTAGLDRLIRSLRTLGSASPVPALPESPRHAIPAVHHVPLPPDPHADPFICGNALPPDLFSGRAAALHRIKELVGHYAGPQSVSIVANRRMGKSSLLHYVAQNYAALFCSQGSYAAVYIDAMAPRSHSNEGFMRILRRGLERQLGRELWSEADDGRLDRICETLEDLSTIDGVRLVLLLDEWESMMAFQEMDQLIDTLRAAGSSGYIGMITATAYSLADLQEQGKLTSPFPNIFTTCYLGNMPAPEWQEVVRAAFARTGLTPEPAEYDLIGNLAGGHPFLTQLAGSLVWRARQGRVSQSDIRLEFEQAARPTFSSLWQRMSPAQIDCIRMALGSTPIKPVPQNTTKELRDRGVIMEHGGVFCEPFAAFALEILEADR